MPGAYVLGGITLLSELPLPELEEVPYEPAPLLPVTIRVGAVPEVVPDAVSISPYCFATPSQYWLHVEGVARYRVSQGCEVLVSPEPDALPLDVRGYLLGTIFSVVCQQRQLLPLHASAVIGPAGVVAFVGHSGQGKSSLAAHLAERGFAVMSDDICLVDTSGGEAMVAPTAPWLKLWRASLENLGRPADALARVFSDDDKYRLPLAPVQGPAPLRTVVFLDRDASLTIEPVSAFAAVPLLMQLIHQAYVLEATGQQAESFRRCSRVSSQVQSFRLKRPWGLAYLEPTVDALVATLF